MTKRAETLRLNAICLGIERKLIEHGTLLNLTMSHHLLRSPSLNKIETLHDYRRSTRVPNEIGAKPSRIKRLQWVIGNSQREVWSGQLLSRMSADPVRATFWQRQPGKRDLSSGCAVLRGEKVSYDAEGLPRLAR